MTDEREESCANCKFRWFATSECHRHAPVIEDGKTVWPVIDDIQDNWCGDFVDFHKDYAASQLSNGERK